MSDLTRRSFAKETFGSLLTFTLLETLFESDVSRHAKSNRLVKRSSCTVNRQQQLRRL